MKHKEFFAALVILGLMGLGCGVPSFLAIAPALRSSTSALDDWCIQGFLLRIVPSHACSL